MKNKRMVRLSWDILKYKYHYYVNNKPIISDYEYDMIEKEYDNLCKDLGVNPTASDMVDFDWNRKCCQLVAAKEQGLGLKMWQSSRLIANKNGDVRAKKRTRKCHSN